MTPLPTRGGKKVWQKGQWAERGVAFWLRCQGYRILHRRWTYKGGEIDIIARRKKTIHIIEVKYRKKSLDEAWASLTPQKLACLEKGVLLFCRKSRQFSSYGIQLDIILVSWGFWPHHFKNVWQIEDRRKA